MSRVEKQSSDCCPPEQPVWPPYNPGILPPLTKSNPVGKKMLYSSVTFLAVERSTESPRGVSFQFELSKREGDARGVRYMPVPPTGATLLAGLIDPSG